MRHTFVRSAGGQLSMDTDNNLCALIGPSDSTQASDWSILFTKDNVSVLPCCLHVYAYNCYICNWIRTNSALQTAIPKLNLVQYPKESYALFYCQINEEDI